MKMIAYAFAIVVGTALAVALGFALSPSGEEAPLSTHGWIAVGLGVGCTVLVGVGLMALVFRSHASGHDDRV